MIPNYYLYVLARRSLRYLSPYPYRSWYHFTSSAQVFMFFWWISTIQSHQLSGTWL